MSYVKRSSWIAGLAALMVMLIHPSNAMAQEAPALEAEPTPAAVELTDAEMTDDELRAFAGVYVAVQELGLQHQAALIAAGSAEEAAELEQQSQAEIGAAIESHGFTAEQYTQTVQALNDSSELQARFAPIVESLSETEPSSN